jgi:hypothetical protein
METNTGKFLTIAATVAAIYIGYKHYKSPGFWSGVGAMVLLGISVKTYKAN